MSERNELRLAGSGGQGVILASIILAEAAMNAGKNVAQSQSYGPEARGGVCKSEVVITDGEIGFPKVINPTFLLALTQDSADKYCKGLPPDCVVMLDSELCVPKGLEEHRVYCVPILESAKEVVGKAFTANIVAIGAINKALSLAPDDVLRYTVGGRVPSGTEAINFKALDVGASLIS